MRRLGSLGARLAAAMVALVVVTAAVTAVSGSVLLRQADDAAAKRGLAMLADSVAAQVDAGADAAAVAATLGTPTVRIAVLRGTRVTGEPIARLATTPEVAEALRSGRTVSRRATLQGGAFLVEGRPVSGGGVVIVQRRADATTLVEQIVPQWLWLVAGTGLVAALVGLLLAWRVARPIRRLALATTEISAGARHPVRVSGPTEVRALADEINQLSAELSRSEARQREFLVSVSHDLRTPLATIAGYAESLAEGSVDGDDVTRIGAVLSAESARLGRMVSDLLDLARADAGELAFHPEPVDVREVVAATATVWRERSTAKGLTFSVADEGTPLPVLADPQRLRQGLDGLLDNAVRVTPTGAPVVLACGRSDGSAYVAVRDGGPGLDDDDLLVAFDKGALHERYRGRREVGTGVGLALVDRLVARQGGTVSAGHAPEGGASFTIRLPLAPVPADPT